MKTKERSEEINQDIATTQNEPQTAGNFSPVDVDDYFGGCPHCGRNDGHWNVGPVHWFTCRNHKVRWCGGSNLLGDWRDELESDWKKNEERLSEFATVMPVFSIAELELGRRTLRPQRASVTYSDHSVDVTTACIRYHPTLESEFQCWATACNRQPAELRSVTEKGVRIHHHNAVVQEWHKAHHGQPDTFTLLFDDLTIFYSLQDGYVLIRGYGYEIDGEAADDFDGGGFYH